MTQTSIPEPPREWIEQLGLRSVQEQAFFISKDQIDAMKASAHSNAMRHAWDDLGLNGILCTDGLPLIYFKEIQIIDPDAVRFLQRQLWNQGLAPVLVLVSPKQVYVYSGLALPAKPDDDPDAQDRLVRILDRVADGLELRSFVQSVELGEIFRHYPNSFKPEHRVDKYFLNNLKILRNRLSSGSNPLDVSLIQSIFGRSIFTCYLIDRNLLPSDYYPLSRNKQKYSKLNAILNQFTLAEGKSFLYGLFKKLKEDFEGDLFDTDLDLEFQRITDEHYELIKRFFNGDQLTKDQLSLGFWAYDFRSIPIETISGIYEDFLDAENSANHKTSAAIYTPRHLAELVIDTATEGWPTLLGKRFLDPACGSGIFLVALFNRLAEECRRKDSKYTPSSHIDSLINILKNNLVGIDIEYPACCVASFSLYLAFLDQLDQRELELLRKQKKSLPRLIAPKGCPTKDLRSYTIICSDFFVISGTEIGTFDLVVGNPPWGQERGDDLSEMEIWAKDQQPIRVIANREKAQGFIWKCPQHLRNNGWVCLLLKASLLLNRDATYPEFQRDWLSTYSVNKINNLSDMVSYLFEDSGERAMIVRYSSKSPNANNDSIEYVSPKSDINSMYADRIIVSPMDRTELRLKDVLHNISQKNAPAIWPRYFWTTPRDRRFLDRLLLLPKLSDIAGPPKSGKRWAVGQGFQKIGKNDPPSTLKDPWWSSRQLFLDGRDDAPDLFLLESDCDPIADRFPKLRRLPSREIFTPPLVIANHGFTRIGFADFQVIFRSTYQAIHGKDEDADLLMFLAAAWTSPLAQYFMFHTSSTWATYRGNLLEMEMMRMPFPMPEDKDDPTTARKLVKNIASLLKQARSAIASNLHKRIEIVEKTKAQVLPLLYEYYDVSSDEEILINDTIRTLWPSRIPRLTDDINSIPTLKITTPTERKSYVSCLTRTLSSWAESSSPSINGSITTASGAGAAIVSLKIGGKATPFVERDASNELEGTLSRLIQYLPQNSLSISYLRGLIVFDADQLHIFKPLSLRYWSHTAALNDADEIANAILADNGSL